MAAAQARPVGEKRTQDVLLCNRQTTTSQQRDVCTGGPCLSHRISGRVLRLLKSPRTTPGSAASLKQQQSSTTRGDT